MDIVLDFDGTVVTHDFPEIGGEIGAVPVLRKLVAHGHRLILFTMRSDREETGGVKDGTIVDAKGMFLTDAIKWFEQNKIPLYGIQKNPTQHTWTTSPKAYGQMIIDDAALGCLLIYGMHLRPYAEWQKIDFSLTEMQLFNTALNQQ